MKHTVLALAAALALGCGDGHEPLDPSTGALGVVADGFVYRASTAVMESFPVQLGTTLTIVNPGGSPGRLVFPDGCVVLLRAYAMEEPDREVWDQADTVACTMALVEIVIRPGGTYEFITRTDAARILGDSLPDGRYRLEAYTRPGPGELAVSAGVVDLAVPRDSSGP